MQPDAGVTLKAIKKKEIDFGTTMLGDVNLVFVGTCHHLFPT